MTNEDKIGPIDPDTMGLIARMPAIVAPTAWIIATDSGPQLVLGDASVPGMPPIVFSRFLVPTDTAGRLAAMLAEAVKQIRQGNNKSGVLN